MGTCPQCGEATEAGRCARCGPLPTKGTLDPRKQAPGSPSEAPTRRMSSADFPAWREPEPRVALWIRLLSLTALVLLGLLMWWLWP